MVSRLHYICAAVLFVHALGARAERDSFFLGNGHSGPLSATSPGTVVNVARALTAPVSRGEAVVPVAGTAVFAQGDLVMLLQTVGNLGVTADQPGPIDLGGTAIGRWELARVHGVAPDRIVLTAPVVGNFESPGAQVVLIPEYTEVAIAVGASVVAPPWDGQAGGVVAFLATGTVTNEGVVDASGAGLRGGTAVVDSSGTGCALLDQPAPQGAQKGEGAQAGVLGPASTGFGNLGNGGGGGVCVNSGGGGGGNAGPGGQGGFSLDAAADGGTRDVGGRGGAELGFSLQERLSPGGGGGAGHQNGAGPSPGGSGGGMIFVRAGAVVGAGRFLAEGLGVPTGQVDGEGGGGAGGSIYLRVVGSLSCTFASANGGAGGSTDHPTPHGTGGGGGAGAVLLQAGSITGCPTSTLPGLAGEWLRQDPRNWRGAMPTSTADPSFQGRLELLPGPFAAPATPTFSAPASFTADPTPVLAGTAQPGVTVHLFLDGQGASAGQTLAAGDGSFSFEVASPLAEGAHTASGVAELLGLSSAPGTHAFTVDLTPPNAPQLTRPAPGSRVATPVEVRGLTGPNFAVEIELDGRMLPRVQADAEGRFEATLPEELTPPGEHVLRARATDLAENQGDFSGELRFFNSPTRLRVGCGAGPGGASALIASGALALWLRGIRLRPVRRTR